MGADLRHGTLLIPTWQQGRAATNESVVTHSERTATARRAIL